MYWFSILTSFTVWISLWVINLTSYYKLFLNWNRFKRSNRVCWHFSLRDYCIKFIIFSTNAVALIIFLNFLIFMLLSNKILHARRITKINWLLSKFHILDRSLLIAVVRQTWLLIYFVSFCTVKSWSFLSFDLFYLILSFIFMIYGHLSQLFNFWINIPSFWNYAWWLMFISNLIWMLSINFNSTQNIDFIFIDNFSSLSMSIFHHESLFLFDLTLAINLFIVEFFWS